MVRFTKFIFRVLAYNFSLPIFSFLFKKNVSKTKKFLLFCLLILIIFYLIAKSSLAEFKLLLIFEPLLLYTCIF